MNNARTSTVIIIGDNADFSYLMQRYVRRSGHHMVVVSPADDVVEVARQHDPAAIILEADSPGAPGWRALRVLKQDGATRHMPVLICSWSDQGACDGLGGAVRYLRKPVLYEDFIVALKEVKIVRE